MMDGFSVGIIGLVLVNIATVAFSYGSLSQKVKDMDRRLERIENRTNGQDCNEKATTKKYSLKNDGK